jgi:hypothetical protein
MCTTCLKVKLSISLIKQQQGTRAYAEVEAFLRAFLTSELDRGEYSASRSGHFISGQKALSKSLCGSHKQCKIRL